MSTKRPRLRDGEELWETTTPGRIWVTTTDHRGHEKSTSVGGGKVGARLRITTMDREINQDRMLEPEADPFANGMLRRADADQNEDPRTATTQALNTEELVALFAKSGNAFQAAVRGLHERNVRRMREMAEEVDASTSQINFLDRHIEKNFRIHSDTATYREMMRDPEEAPTT